MTSDSSAGNDTLILGYFTKNVTSRLSCDIPSSNDDTGSYSYDCDDLEIWLPYDDEYFSAQWETTILSDYDSGKLHFNTLLLFPNWDPDVFGTLTFKYVYQNQEFVVAEMIVRCVLCGITGLLLIFWVYRLSNYRVSCCPPL